MRCDQPVVFVWNLDIEFVSRGDPKREFAVLVMTYHPNTFDDLYGEA